MLLSSNKWIKVLIIIFLTTANWVEASTGYQAISRQPAVNSRIQPHSSIPMLLNKSDIQRLLSWNLFGQSMLSVSATKNYSFIVTGIIQSTIPQRTAVLIATKDGKEQVYMPGDHLPNGDKLERIDRDQVIISHVGQLHALVLDENDNNLGGENNFDNPDYANTNDDNSANVSQGYQPFGRNINSIINRAKFNR